MNELQMVVFDLDGLLLDTEQLYHRGWIWVANKNGIPLKSEDMQGWGGQSSDQTMEKLKKIFGDNETIARFKEEREGFIATEVEAGKLHLKPYAREVLQKVREKGLKVGLSTSTFKYRGDFYFQHFDLGKYFDATTFGDQVEHIKPDPDIYLATLAKAGVSPEYAIAVEDSFTGALAATRASLPVALIPDSSMPYQMPADKKAQLNVLLEGTDLRALLDWLDQEIQ